MEQSFKRVKCTKGTTIEDIAAYIRDISASLKTISESHRALLRVNKAVVAYIQKSKVDASRNDSEPTMPSDKTMDENTQAISFANSYFALVDGLASGLESHLSENVVLDWFGRTVKGRKNVSAFMETHKVNSRHRFARIAPATDIGYKRKHLNRKKFCSYHDRNNEGNPKEDSGIISGNRDAGDGLFFRETEMSSTGSVTKDFNQNEIVGKGIIGSMEDMFYYLTEGDLNNLFKLEITSTDVEEIGRSINRIKLEEEMAPTMKVIKRECGQGDGPDVVETSTIKYMEADGAIEFSRKFWKKDAWSAYFSATSNVHTWRRPCKLQVAYSTLTDCPTLELPLKSKNTRFPVEEPKARLPSLEEISEISNRLVPNTNDFGGFLKNVDFFEDRRDFLESLEIEMASKVPCTPLFAPQYVEDKLVYDKPCVNVADCNGKSRKRFVFNYQIHLIIYEGNNKCKMNLLHEFERTKF